MKKIMGFLIADRFRPRRATRSMGRIITIDVAPPAQHSGLGTLLMSSVEAELKQAVDCDYVSLEVAVDNDSAPKFYVLGKHAATPCWKTSAALLSGFN